MYSQNCQSVFASGEFCNTIIFFFEFQTKEVGELKLKTGKRAGPWENESYVICEQQRRRSACASVQSDQRRCCSLLYNISRFYSRNFKTLASFCGCADRFVYGLVGNSRGNVLSCRDSNIFSVYILNSSANATFFLAFFENEMNCYPAVLHLQVGLSSDDVTRG